MGEGGGFIFDSQHRFLAVSLKKCLSGDNYRRPPQIFLTRIVYYSTTCRDNTCLVMGLGSMVGLSLNKAIEIVNTIKAPFILFINPLHASQICPRWH